MNAIFIRRVVHGLTLACALAGTLAMPAQAAGPQDATQDLGEKVPDATTVREGLFPEDACKELEAVGYKCMGSFKRPVRYALSFNVGSAELPEGLRRQLDIFASVLSEKRGSGRVIRVEGHADASGTEDTNQALSQRRADAVKFYLVNKGADPAMLETVGRGSKAPKDGSDPFAPVNRRVEIARQQTP